METTKKQELSILTSQIKKGDVININNYQCTVLSDAYKHEDIWSIDIVDGRYGFFSRDVKVKVLR